MDIDDIEAGMLVQIIVYEDHRPDHWSSEMDDWQGEVVTVADYNRSSEEVWIEEDEGNWQWFPWDFEFYNILKFDNPNIKFKNHKYQKMLEEFRTGFRAKKEFKHE